VLVYAEYDNKRDTTVQLFQRLLQQHATKTCERLHVQFHAFLTTTLTRSGVVSFTPQPFYATKEPAAPTGQEARCAPKTDWTLWRTERTLAPARKHKLRCKFDNERWIISFQQKILQYLLERSNEGHFITVYRPELLICANASVFIHEVVTIALNFKIIQTLCTQLPWKMLKYDCRRFAYSKFGAHGTVHN